MGSTAEQDWVRLGRAVADARRALPGRPTQRGFAARVGVSRATVQAVERGVGFTRVTPTLRAVERALGWREGSVEVVLSGGRPEPAPAAAGGPAADEPAGGPRGPLAGGLPRRIMHELSEGQVVDTSVLDFGGDGSGTRMIVVVKHDGEAELDTERLRSDLELWTRIERRLRDLAEHRRPEDPPRDDRQPGN